MNCEAYELALLSDEPLSEEAKAHAAACTACAAFRDQVPGLLADAALPPVSEEERARLASLPQAVLQAYRAERAPRSGWRQVVSLALAASLGAGIASAVLLKLSPGPASAGGATVVRALPDAVAVAEPGWELPAADDGSDLEALEVSWPSINEGDVP